MSEHGPLARLRLLSAIARSGLPHSALAVAVELMQCLNGADGTARPGLRYLASTLGLSKSTAAVALNALIEAGFISKTVRRGRGHTTSYAPCWEKTSREPVVHINCPTGRTDSAESVRQAGQFEAVKCPIPPTENVRFDASHIENKKEEQDSGPPPSASAYAFQGKVIKLVSTGKSGNGLEDLRRRYHTIIDLEAELHRIDAELDGTKNADPARWYQVMVAKLNHKHQRHLAERKSARPTMARKLESI